MARVLVIGSGAIGSILAARISQRHDVTLACRTKVAAKHIAAQGLRATGFDGTLVKAQPDVVATPEPLDVDAVISTTKFRDAELAWTSWAGHVPSNAALIGTQNGLIGDLFAQEDGRYVAATVAFPARLNGPGAAEQLAPGGFIVGTWPSGPPTPPVELARQILGCAGKVKVSRDMEGVQWTKLLINAAMTGLGIVTGESVGNVLASKRGREAVRRLMAEGLHVGRGAGVQFARISGFHPRMLAADGRLIPAALQHFLLHSYGKKYSVHKSSSAPDFAAGKPTEIPYLNGAIVAAAKEYGSNAPMHEAICRIVAELEAGTRAPGIELLAEL